VFQGFSWIHPLSPVSDMPLYEAEAIVLRQYALSDSDRIIVLITKEFGKIRAVAKGARKLQNRLAGTLEPLNHIRIEYYWREGHDLCQIRHAELVRSYLGLNPTVQQVYAYSYFAELANEIVQDNQANYPLFRLLLSAMEAGEKNGVNQALVRYVESWCLRLSGLFPNYAYCSNCGKCVKDDGFFAWIERGQSLCRVCSRGNGLAIRAEASVVLDEMMKLSPEKFAARTITVDAGKDIERLTQKLLNFHIEKQLKSYRILKEALLG
jgi:DNA repair protein RecO (recombination protein O)